MQLKAAKLPDSLPMNQPPFSVQPFQGGQHLPGQGGGRAQAMVPGPEGPDGQGTYPPDGTQEGRRVGGGVEQVQLALVEQVP